MPLLLDALPVAGATVRRLVSALVPLSWSFLCGLLLVVVAVEFCLLFEPAAEHFSGLFERYFDFFF